MSNNLFISASCVIRHFVVYKNGQPVFAEKGLELPEFLIAAYRKFELQYPKYFKMDNLSKLGWLANEILLQDGFDKEKYKPEDIGIVFSNANSSLDTDIKFYGDGFVLTGNVTEFLDPVFSSGVTLATVSSQTAAHLVI